MFFYKEWQNYSQSPKFSCNKFPNFHIFPIVSNSKMAWKQKTLCFELRCIFWFLKLARYFSYYQFLGPWYSLSCHVYFLSLRKLGVVASQNVGCYFCDFVFVTVLWNNICCCLLVLSLSHSFGRFVYFVSSLFPSLFSVHSIHAMRSMNKIIGPRCQKPYCAQSEAEGHGMIFEITEGLWFNHDPNKKWSIYWIWIF